MKSTKRKYFLLILSYLLVNSINLSANNNCIGTEKWNECNPSTTCSLAAIAANNPTYTDFTSEQGWNATRHIRTTGDVNGDGKTDIIGFGETSVFVAFGEANGRFSFPKAVLHKLTIGRGGWSVTENPRMLADVNGDGKDDIVGFGNEGVIVAFSYGTWFSNPQLLLKNYSTINGGWKGNSHPRMMADVNGDGKADVVGFGENSVSVAFSQGGTFSKPTTFSTDFVISKGWSTKTHIRTMGDVNGDGKADILAFGENGVRFALSTGTQFSTGITVLKGKLSIAGGGWKVGDHPRMAADVNGDGKDDIIAFGNAGVQVALSNGNGFNSPKQLIGKFGYKAGNWRGAKHTRLAADVNNDGKADILCFGGNRVIRSYSRGATLQTAENLFFNIPTEKITGIAKSRVIETTRGKTQDYNFSQTALVKMKGSNKNIGGLSLNFTPKSAYINDEGFLYVYLNMEGSTIDMTNYTNQARTKGYYLKEVEVTLEAEGMQKFRMSPLNKSAEGVYGTSEQFDLGVGVTGEGAGGGIQKSWGSSFATKVKDFQFANKTKQSNKPKFFWNLGKVGDATKGETPTVYTGFRSLGIQSASQYTSLMHLPPLAAENFPIDCEGIFRKNVAHNPNNIPNKVTVRVFVKATFEKTRLVAREESDFESFINGFIFIANPRTYAGEQFYIFRNDLEITENFIEVELDLSDLKK